MKVLNLKKVRWYFMRHCWWRDLVPWWVLGFVNDHFNVCWANIVRWKMLDSECGWKVESSCGLEDGIPDGKGGWATGFPGNCYCGLYTSETSLRRDCDRSAYSKRIQ